MINLPALLAVFGLVCLFTGIEIVRVINKLYSFRQDGSKIASPLADRKDEAIQKLGFVLVIVGATLVTSNVFQLVVSLISKQ